MWTLLLPFVLFQSDPSQPDLNFEVPTGTQIHLFAESPMVFNPTAIDVDDKGNVWVTEGVNYRRWKEQNQGVERPNGDRVIVLEDSDGDGVADRSRVFAEDPDLTAPLGIKVIGDKVYVSCSPNLFVYRDTDGDGKADERKVLLTGFGGFDHDHGLHSVVEHPSGDLLWCAGNAGPHVVTDADGFTLRSGSYYNGGGEKHPGNRPGLVSDDGRAWTGGLIGSMSPDGGNLKVLAHNFRNQYEVAVDSYGTMYTFDNDDDGNQGVRAVAITPGGNYGFFSEDGSRSWQADRRAGMTTQEAHWHQWDPGVMPAGTMTGAGAPCGIAVYESGAIPQLTGDVLMADAGRSLVYAMRPVVDGAAIRLEEGLLLQPGLNAENERGQWFRPSDVAVGPDGSIYISDWFDPGVGGHWAGDRKSYGRIVRLRSDGPQPGPAIVGASKAKMSMIRRARQIWARKEALQPSHSPIADREPLLRLTQCRKALSMQPELAAVYAPLSDDLIIKAHAVVELRDFSWEDSQVALLSFAKHYDGQDRTYLEAVGIGARGKEAELFLALLQTWKPDTDFQKLLDFAWRLHPIEAHAFLGGIANDAARPWPVRRKALDAIAFMPERAAAEFMVAHALAGPADARVYAADWVRQRSAGFWSAYGLQGELAGDFGQAEEVWRSGEVTTDSVALEVDLTGAEVLWLSVDPGGDGNGCDWVAWVNPMLETSEGQIRLSEISWSQAETEWGASRWNQSCDGSELFVGGEKVEYGLGTHAQSRIAFPLPPGTHKFTAMAAPDDGGGQGACSPTIEFAVALEYGERKEAQLAQQDAVLQGSIEAGQALVGSVSGALFLLDKARDKALAAPVVEAITKPLQQHADLSVRALASEVFPLKTVFGAELPALDELADLPGSVHRGRELFRGRATCFVCHQYDGLGGAIGPDLTTIGGKYDSKALLDSMLNPSASITFGFDSWQFVLKDGRHLAGALLADGESIVLRDLAGKRHLIAASDVESRRKSEVSTMPSPLAIGLGAQDLADIVAFLKHDLAHDPEFGEPVALFNGKDLTGWTSFLNGGGQTEDVWSVEDGILKCKGNPIGYLYTEQEYTNFELEVEWRFDPKTGGGNSGVLMRVQKPHKVWPLSIEAQLQSRSAGDIWNIGEFPMLTVAERTNGRHTQKLLPSNEKPLGEWNHYRIRLVGGELSLTVNGEVQNTAKWCKEIAGPIALQSEGVPIEFRRVEIRELKPH